MISMRITSKGKPALVNAEHIIKLEPSDTGCTMYFAGGKLILCDQDYNMVADFIASRSDEINRKEKHEQTTN